MRRALLAWLALAGLAAKPSPIPPPADPAAAEYAAAVAELARDRALPRAIVPLARLHALEDELPDLAKLARAYAEVAQDPRAPAEVRSLARFFLAGVDRSRGNLPRAAADLARLGFLGGWQAVGPFDDEGRRGFDAVYPPEQGLDLAARYPGKVREVAWRPVPPEAATTGFVNLGAIFRPARDVTVYALAAVDSPREQRADLWIGASGAVKVWVNDVLALSDAARHPARLDQLGVRVTLRKGPNRILLKLCHEEGRLGFYARLADPSGRALPVSRVGMPPLPPAARPGPGPERIEGLVGRLERRAESARGDAAAAARMDLAVAAAERQGDDLHDRRASQEARRAAALAPGSVEAQLLVYQLDDDPNRRRAALEAVLAASPSEPRALAALGRLELARGRPVEAARLLERAVAAAPGWVAARVVLAEALERAGLGARGERQAARLASGNPTSPPAVAAAARAARELDRSAEAAALYRKLLALRYDDEPARGALSQLLLDRGDLEGALGILEGSARLDPADVFLRLRRADLLAANGRREEAEAEYAAAERICPEEEEIYERRGRARLRAGRQKDALADLQRALELKPQNPQLKELVRRLSPESERFEKPYLLDAAALARSAPAPAPDEDALVLGELKVTKVFPSGLSATYVEYVTKVFDARGADAWRQHAIQYAPDRQEIRVDRARVRKPDGTVVESLQESERSASEPWYRLYYDTRVRTLSFPSLAPGDVLEVAYRTDDVASDNLLSDYFGDVTYLADTTRKLRSDYVLLVPAGRSIHASDPGLPGLARTERPLEGGRVVERRWTARDVPAIEPEPMMPGWSEVSPFVHVSTYADWDEVAGFYWRLVRDALRPTPEVRETAARIAREARPAAPGGAADPVALVRAVHDFVVTGTRYVGLEFGIHGYKPYRVDQILDRRFGDCKDKASLMHALLESLGIDSRLVLLRMRRLGRIPDRPASLAVFNHAILYVPSLDLWLDGTASYSGSGELPGEDRGAAVLVVNPGAAARFGRVPEARAGDNLTESRFEVALAADGSARVSGSSRIQGAQAPEYRRAYQAENDRRALLEQAFSRTFPGLKVEEVEVSDPARIEEPVSLRFALSMRRFAQADGPGLRFGPFGASHTYAETYAPLSSRRYDLVLGGPWENRFAYRYRLPPGYRPASLPDPARFEAPFGSFEVTVAEEEGGLVARGIVAFRRDRIAVADYPAFRDFVSRIDRALARPVRIAPAEPPRAGL